MLMDHSLYFLLAQLTATRVAHLLGQGKDYPKYKQWFDMEYEDEIIQMRSQRSGVTDTTQKGCLWIHREADAARTGTRSWHRNPPKRNLFPDVLLPLAAEEHRAT